MPKPANVFRVIVLGGSTVLGQGAASPADALPAILEHRLRDRSEPSIEVINGWPIPRRGSISGC